MGEHIPGPWEMGQVFDGKGRPVSEEAYISAGGDDQTLEITVITHDGTPAYFTAALISAAPDLLEALDLVLPIVEKVAGSKSEQSELIAFCRAALRKATGHD